MKIKEFKIGAVVITELVLKEASIRQTKTKKDYLNAVFTDGNEDINAKIWDWPSDMKVPEPKMVYDVVATVGEYMGSKQLMLSSMTPAADQDMTQFMTSVGIPVDELKGVLYSCIDSIEDPDIKLIVQHIYTQHMDAIVTCTAAKGVHHVGVGGLALHTYEVFKTVIAIYDAYPHLGMDLDLLKAGALLHDIGKIFTYVQEGPVIDYTIIGNLYDHIGVGMMMLETAASLLPTQCINKLCLLHHIIASHHGQLEFGSLVTPKFMEAYVINYADGISATLDTIHTANKGVTNGDAMTARIFTCGNKQHLTQNTVMQILSGNTVL